MSLEQGIIAALIVIPSIIFAIFAYSKIVLEYYDRKEVKNHKEQKEINRMCQNALEAWEVKE